MTMMTTGAGMMITAAATMTLAGGTTITGPSRARLKKKRGGFLEDLFDFG